MKESYRKGIANHLASSLGMGMGRQCAGINRHVVGNERVLQERNSEPPGLESCGVRREARVEAYTEASVGWVLSFENLVWDADPVDVRGRPHAGRRKRETTGDPT